MLSDNLSDIFYLKNIMPFLNYDVLKFLLTVRENKGKLSSS